MTSATGSVVNNYSYLPFGEKLASSGSVANPFTYVGEFGVMDEGSGLYYMRDRWYNPALGRFVQVDPLGTAADVNPYRYALNDPLRYVDPSGAILGFATSALGAVAGVANTNTQNGAADTTGHALNVAGAFGSKMGDLGTVVGAAGSGATAANAIFNTIQGNESISDGIHDTVTALAPLIDSVIPETPATAPLKFVLSNAGNIDEISQYVFNKGASWWYEPDSPFGPAMPPGSPTRTSVVHSIDPNGKLTDGFGSQGYIPPNIAIPYTIYFENQSTASAPAQEVTVTDPLPSNLDWSTVQLNQIEFNNVTVNVPGGLQSYTGQVNVSTDPNPVNVSASLNPNTGVLSWTMQSVSATTGSAPQNPLAGFLPPNTSNNQGTGFVTFTVSPKTSLGNGAVINNQASIVFDANTPIATNAVTNTIDSTVPTSSVSPLPAATSTTSFAVSWSGSDPGGSGIAGYNIFVSDTGGAYASWMSNSAQTSATYNGVAGHSYSFYSLAVNNVGTIQTAPGPAQTTMVPQSATPPGACAVTGDVTATVSDVQLMINQALGAAHPANDLNQDGIVNVIDVQIVLAAALGLGCTT
jgi:RHS repeat-associated protein